MPTVLVTNGMLRKTLAATRALGRNGWNVVVGEDSFPSPAAWSKFAGCAVRYPNPSTDPARFADWLETLVRASGIDVYLPMDDDIMDIAVNEQDRLRDRVGLLVPEADSYETVRDKHRAVTVAKSVGMSVPETWWPQDEDDVVKMANDFVYPIVIRARKASGSRGLAIVQSASELLMIYRKVAENYDKPMLQQFIPSGPRVDVALMFDAESRLHAVFVQRELRHFPMPRGPSTAVESTQFPALEQLCFQMAKQLAWKGIIEFEFMHDSQTGRWMFMEANPRMWNSLQLAIRCGVDFPSLYARLCLEGGEVSPMGFYPRGIRSRFLWPSDILYHLSWKSWFHLWSRTGTNDGVKEKDDVWERDDPLPLLGHLTLLLLSIFKPKMWKLLFDR